MRPHLRQEGLTPTPGTLRPSAFLLMCWFHSQRWGPFCHNPRNRELFAQVPDSFQIPSKSSLAIWKGRGLPSSTPCLSPSCPLPAPQEGADVGLEEVKSTSAAFLWSLVIQKAGWGESTGKKEGGEKATRDILYNSKEQRSL